MNEEPHEGGFPPRPDTEIPPFVKRPKPFQMSVRVKGRKVIVTMPDQTEKSYEIYPEESE